jgi:hypothetical protein
MRAGKLELGKIRVQIGIEERQTSEEEEVASTSAGGKRMYRVDSLV